MRILSYVSALVLCFVSLVSCSDDDTTASTTTTTGAAGGEGGTTPSGGSGGSAGTAGSGGSGGSYRATWPGTTTRFFPGIYFLAGRNADPNRCSTVFDEAFGSHNDGEDWREENAAGTKITYVGVAVWINVETFYQDPNVAPEAYDSTCSRSATAADPNWSNYSWDYLESVLAEPFIANGGKLFVAIDDTFSNPLPQWMIDQGMAYTSDNRAALWRQTTMAALRDFYEAFATRFAGDERIASVMLTETYRGADPMPPDFDTGASTCGNIDGLTGIDAARQGRIYEAVALKAGDPDLMVTVMNLVPAMETGYASGSPGMNDLPGQWGGFTNGARLFVSDCGSGAAGEVDCTESPHSGFWTRQTYGITGSHAAGVDTQTNEWEISNTTCCRLNDENPWAYSEWPVVPGYWPGQGGEWKDQPTTAQWVWYNSGEPKNANDDSGLGQSGRDPGGVSPVHFYLARNLPLPDLQASETDETSVDTRTYANFAEAFDTFGPPGTGAMFVYPAGYR